VVLVFGLGLVSSGLLVLDLVLVLRIIFWFVYSTGIEMAKKICMKKKKLFTGKMSLELNKNNEMLGLDSGV